MEKLPNHMYRLVLNQEIPFKSDVLFFCIIVPAVRRKISMEKQKPLSKCIFAAVNFDIDCHKFYAKR